MKDEPPAIQVQHAFHRPLRHSAWRSQNAFYRAPVQASLEQRQRFQQLFIPEGIAFDGKGFVGTRVTAPAFSYLREIETGNERMVDQMGIEPLHKHVACG
jgi:hypothetical protein